MKNRKIMLVLLVFISAFLLVACKPQVIGPPDIPPDVPDPPTLVVTSPQGVIPYGDIVTFSWSAEGVVTSVTLNNKSVDKSGSFTTGRLLENETHSLYVSGPGGQVSKTITLTVGDWKSSTYGMISYGYWIFDTLSVKNPATNNVWYTYTEAQIGGVFSTEEYHYLPSGVFNLYEPGVPTYTTTWSLVGNIMTFQGRNRIISQITPDHFVFVVDTPFYSDTDGDGWITDKDIVITGYSRWSFKRPKQ